MTCIVGIETGSVVLMASESLSSIGSNAKLVAREDKIFTVDIASTPMLVGVAGDFRTSQILRYIWNPRTDGRLDGVAYIVALSSQIRELLRKEGALASDDGVEFMDSTIMIGFRGELYTIYQDFSVASREQGYDAIGSGAPYALGVLYALEQDLDFDDQASAELAARLAVKAAIVFDSSCGGDITLKVVGE